MKSRQLYITYLNCINFNKNKAFFLINFVVFLR